MYRERILPGLLVLCAGLTLWSCAGGESGPAQGTPEWHWQAALESYNSGDFPRALENLDEIIKAGDSALLAKAHVWRMTLLSGLTRGYGGLWTAFDKGAKANATLARTVQTPMQDSQRQLRRFAIDLVESMGKTRTALGASDKVVFDFPFPPGSPALSPVVNSITGGTAVPETQIPMAQKAEIERGLIYAATYLIGEGDAANTAKTRFATLPIEIGTDVFFLRLAEGLNETARLFARRHINEPKIREPMIATVTKIAEAAAELADEELANAAKALLEEIDADAQEEARTR